MRALDDLSYVKDDKGNNNVLKGIFSMQFNKDGFKSSKSKKFCLSKIKIFSPDSFFVNKINLN